MPPLSSESEVSQTNIQEADGKLSSVAPAWDRKVRPISVEESWLITTRHSENPNERQWRMGYDSVKLIREICVYSYFTQFYRLFFLIGYLATPTPGTEIEQSV
jgi:hypothetical protein